MTDKEAWITYTRYDWEVPETAAVLQTADTLYKYTHQCILRRALLQGQKEVSVSTDSHT